MKDITYRGLLCITSNGEDDNLVGLLSSDTHRVAILAELLADDVRLNGRFVTVSYFLSDIPLTETIAQMQHILNLCGKADAKYGMHYSEYTGYLWTDEELKI